MGDLAVSSSAAEHGELERRPLHTSDFELVCAAQAGDQHAIDALFARHRGLILGISQQFFMRGADRDDVIQEARIGLWKGIRDYDPSRGTLNAFLGLCVRRQVITGVKTARRFKHDALNNRLVDVVAEDGDLLQLFETIPDPAPGALEQLEQRDDIRALVDAVSGMTELERRALVGFHVEGLSYAEIHGGDRTGSRGTTLYKRVDNAMQRAIGKLRERLDVPLPPTVLQAA